MPCMCSGSTSAEDFHQLSQRRKAFLFVPKDKVSGGPNSPWVQNQSKSPQLWAIIQPQVGRQHFVIHFRTFFTKLTNRTNCRREMVKRYSGFRAMKHPRWWWRRVWPWAAPHAKNEGGHEWALLVPPPRLLWQPPFAFLSVWLLPN